MWPTPIRSLYCDRIELELSAKGMKFRNDPRQVGSQIALGKVARLWTHIWLLIRMTGAVPATAANFPSTRPLHISLNAGPRSSPGDLTFNPNFSDWIMGWPIGWTDPTRPVTGFARWRQRMRGELSRLPTACESR